MERKRRFPVAEKPKRKAVQSKTDRIMGSRMPAWQKVEYLKQCGLVTSAPEEKGKVSFGVYAKLRSIGDNFHGAMLAFPPAKDKELETPKQWDQIFRKF